MFLSSSKPPGKTTCWFKCAALRTTIALGRFPPGLHFPFEGKNNSVAANRPPSLSPPATSKACSPFIKKLEQPCRYLGVARLGRDSRYLPSESYLSTFPWGLSLSPSQPPIVRKPSSQTSAHVPITLCLRVSSLPPSPTISPVFVLCTPPRMNILSLIE